MTFAHPQLLNVVWIVGLPLVALGWWSRRRRARDWAALGQSMRLPGEGTWAYVAAIVLLATALASPRWGHAERETVPGHDVVLLVDVSRSMAAEDAVPDRLGLAIAAGEQLVAAIGQEPGGRMAVVAFAGRGVVRCPLTENLGAVADVLRSLRTGTVRPGGTNLGAGLEAAADLFTTDGPLEPAEGRSIVLLTDGENLAGAWKPHLEALRENHILVHAVAVGDADRGHPIPLEEASKTNADEQQYVTYHGSVVLSQRDDRPLEEITHAAGGALVRLGLSRPDGLETIYRERIAPVAKGRRQRDGRYEQIERFPIFVGAALIVLLAGPVAARMQARFWALAVLALLAGAAEPSSGDRSVGAIARAGDDHASRGDWQTALSHYEKAIALAPDEPLLRYDAGAVLYRLGRFAEAAARYQEARVRADDPLRTKIDFALGNTAFASGDIPAALKYYESCMKSSARGDVADAVRRDAAINRQFVAQYQREHPQKSSKPEQKADSNRPPAEAPKPRPDANEGKEDAQKSRAGSGAKSSPTAEQRKGGDRSGSSEPQQQESPQDRLERAVRAIQDARSHRLSDSPPASFAEEERDW